MNNQAPESKQCPTDRYRRALPFMTDNNAEQVRERVDAVYKAESRGFSRL